MKKMNLLASLMLAVLIASCSSSPERLLIGKWNPTGKTAQDADAPSQLEFTKDKMKMTMGGMSIEMAYQWVADDKIEMNMMGHADIKVDKKSLTMTVAGDANTFERAK